MKAALAFAVFVILEVARSVSLAAEVEVPKACNLSPITRPSVGGTINLQPNSPTAFELSRSVTMQIRTASDANKTKYIQFEETGKIALAPDALTTVMTAAVAGLRSRAGETCQFSISTFSGTADWAIPPNFQIRADGQGRKCTSFSYPCGTPSIHCDTKWGIPYNCYPQQPMCLATQATPISDWSMSIAGQLPIKLGDDRKSFNVYAVRGDPVIDTGGSGEVAKILDAVGLGKIFANIDTSLKNQVSLDSIPTVSQILSIIAPSDQLGPAQIQAVAWTNIPNTQSGKLSSVGISYNQSFSVKLKSGCLLAQCLRNASRDEEVSNCVLNP